MEFIVSEVGTDYKNAGVCVETVDNTYIAGAAVSGKCAIEAAKKLRAEIVVEVAAGGLAMGALIGIIVGSLVLVAVVIGVVCFMMRRNAHQGELLEANKTV